MAKILFVLKKRETYYVGEENSCYSGGYTLLNSGLFNSATFVCDMLIHLGYEAKLVHVIDGHCAIASIKKFLNINLT